MFFFFPSRLRCRWESLLKQRRVCLFPMGGRGSRKTSSCLSSCSYVGSLSVFAADEAAGISGPGNSSPARAAASLPRTPPQPPPPLPPFPPLLFHLVLFLLLFLFLLLRGVGVPGEALLVERDHHLGALDVGLLGRDQVGLVRVLPDNGTGPKSDRGGKREEMWMTGK